MEKRRQPEIIAGRVNADGTIGMGDGFSVSKAGTGLYDITFVQGFRVASVTANLQTGSGFALVSYTSERVVRVTPLIFNTGAATDFAFSFVATGPQV